MIDLFVTILILIFTGLTFWYEVLRTPSSKVKMELIERKEPYSTTAANVTFRDQPLQLFNEGEMEAIIHGCNAEIGIFEKDSGNLLDVEEENYSVSFGTQRKSLNAGEGIRLKGSISLENLDKFPSEFRIYTKYIVNIQDNKNEYEIIDEHEFLVKNKRKME